MDWHRSPFALMPSVVKKLIFLDLSIVESWVGWLKSSTLSVNCLGYSSLHWPLVYDTISVAVLWWMLEQFTRFEFYASLTYIWHISITLNLCPNRWITYRLVTLNPDNWHYLISCFPEIARCAFAFAFTFCMFLISSGSLLFRSVTLNSCVYTYTARLQTAATMTASINKGCWAAEGV